MIESRSPLRGGSLCNVELIQAANFSFIRKSGRGGIAQKLKDQFEWTTKYGKALNAPQVLDFYQNDDFAYIDLEYLPNSISFEKWVLSETQERIDVILLNLLEKIADTKPSETKQESYFLNSDLSKYLDLKIAKKLRDIVALESRLDFSNQLLKKEVVINGVKYESLLKSSECLSSTLTNLYESEKYQRYPIHGDLTFENILIANDSMHTIDPNPKNCISDRSVEYAKIYQSAHGYFEFLTNCKLVQVKDSEFEIVWPRMIQIEQARISLDSFLLKNFGESFLVKTRIHEIVHFIRLLPYRAQLNPATFMIFELRTRYLIEKFRDDFSL